MLSSMITSLLNLKSIRKIKRESLKAGNKTHGIPAGEQCIQYALNIVEEAGTSYMDVVSKKQRLHLSSLPTSMHFVLIPKVLLQSSRTVIHSIIYAIGVCSFYLQLCNVDRNT